VTSGPPVAAGKIFQAGAITDRRFRAFDSKTGNELWAVKLDKNVNGKQYVAVVATDSLMVFALP